jgi:chitinase
MYIPAAPTCVTTDPSIPRAVLALVDFVFIRFYNSAKCGLGTPGFDQSLQQWYESFVPDPHSVFPKAILGGLSFDNGNQGYVSHESFGDALRTARRPELICPCWPREKFGGAMLWDGPRGLANEVEPGLNYVDHVKNVMTEAY